MDTNEFPGVMKAPLPGQVESDSARVSGQYGLGAQGLPQMGRPMQFVPLPEEAPSPRQSNKLLAVIAVAGLGLAGFGVWQAVSREPSPEKPRSRARASTPQVNQLTMMREAMQMAREAQQMQREHMDRMRAAMVESEYGYVPPMMAEDE
ncbi:MAG: hypothetical protein H6811_09790 [Phycisphaeraceae bacterium]|nr:hypothetical protein [Phycisphaeraceae bacterium]